MDTLIMLLKYEGLTTLKICLELGGPLHSGAPGLWPPCPPYCYANV